MTENEWVNACKERSRFWLCEVFDCGAAIPRLPRVNDMFGNLVVKGRLDVQISSGSLFGAAALD
jgi:hypothetical protein